MNGHQLPHRRRHVLHPADVASECSCRIATSSSRAPYDADVGDPRQGGAVQTEGYTAYTTDLRKLGDAATRAPWPSVRGDVHKALNGQAAEQLRRLVPRQVRRDKGAFFTGGEIRATLTGMLQTHEGPYWDPTCGAGDLLLAASEQLPVETSIQRTLHEWGRVLHGGDLQPAFAEATKLRLFLAAVARHRDRGDSVEVRSHEAVHAFRNIRIEDARESLQRSRKFSGTLIMNPPYGTVTAEEECPWGSGLVSQAAIMALRGMQNLAIGREFLAVLPDVLRSGSRYARWRSEVESVLKLRKVHLHGQFDPHTDIDVFLISGERRRRVNISSRSPLWWAENNASSTVEDSFEVSVGPVVDNRDPHEGPSFPFLIARDLKAASEMPAPERTRSFNGRTLDPPFVAIKRTSRPGLGAGGSARAAGVVITGTRQVAVDNHIIVARPRSGTEEDCRRLIDILASEETSTWLDGRIRCRHLTVGVVKSIPWPVG
ncbi:N-6 DNA methylase [Kitasatospora indigofera]|uniref:N-6 DNA methylase n=1 Tax=Kitasatospora indigofera TaxID=67307 RepID=UPI00363509E8